MRELPLSQRPLMLGTVAACVLGLAACQAPVSPAGTEYIPEPTVSVEQRQIEIYFATDRAELDADQTARLAQFLADLDPPANSLVSLTGHADYRSSDQHNLALSERRIAAVRQEIETLGYRDLQIDAEAYGEHQAVQPPATPAALARDRRTGVTVQVFAAVGPPCPNWSRSVAFDPQNLPSSNLGCANATNLAAMIADPRDLAEGRTPGPTDGAQAIGAIERYRTDEVKELSKELASE
ncbi:MAG: CpaD family pilus assembly lipoprotein [Pseudomonadota bacterium]